MSEEQGASLTGPMPPLSDSSEIGNFESEEQGASLTGPMPPLSDSSEIGNFENDAQYQVMQIQRCVQELQKEQTATANQIKEIVSMKADEIATRAQFRAMETDLAEVKTAVITLMRQFEEQKRVVQAARLPLMRQFEEQKGVAPGLGVVSMRADEIATAQALYRTMETDMAEVKTAVITLMRQFEEQKRVVQAARVANPTVPDNLNEKFEDLGRHLGMYDVKLAEIDTRFQVLETTNYDGKLVWKISDFDRRRDHAKRGQALSIYSQPFYTSRYGYKMCLRIYLNGDGMGENTHISLFFVLMRGDNDDFLSFPFRHKVTLMLLDQGPDQQHLSDGFRPDPTSSSFKKPTSDMNIASGFPMFVAHDTINGSSYLRNDTIVFGVEIDAADDMPPY